MWIASVYAQLRFIRTFRRLFRKPTLAWSKKPGVGLMLKFVLKFAVGGLALLALSGCAGRAPQISPLIHATDHHLGCDQIAAEAKINNERISTLATEQSLKMGQNVVAGVAGFMIWPAWLGLDFQDAAGKEARALSQRNEYLQAMAKDRCLPKNQIARAAPPPATEPYLSSFASNSEIAASLVNR
jgi:hypothetical protein